MSKIILPNEQEKTYRIRCAKYGVGGSGKSSLDHLPSSGDSWTTPAGEPGMIVLIASDTTSQKLRSYTQEFRKRLIVIIPDGNPTKTKAKDKRTGDDIEYLEVNWREEAARLCQTKFTDKFSKDVVAVIWDTFTATAEELLAQSAQRGEFSDKGPSQTGPKNKVSLGKEEGTAMPMEGDYRGTQQTMIRNIKWLLHWNRDIHVIVNFHECLNDKIKMSGPMTVGGMGPLQMPQRFDMCVQTSIESKGENKGKTKVTFRHPEMITNLKCADASLVPDAKYVAATTPAREDFWNWVLEVQS